MFRIGDFSRLSQVTVKTLRYYDDVGLLRPARVDEFTGYRQYTTAQLPRLNRILALKDLGFSLEQIATLLDGELAPERLRAMLRDKRAELTARVEEEQARLGRVEARLRQIEREGTWMRDYEITLKSAEAMTVASVRQTLHSFGDVSGLFEELGQWIRQKGVRVVGPMFATWYIDEYREHDIDSEALTPIASKVAGDDRIQVRDLLRVATMATTVHYGPYDNLNASYQAVITWIGENEYRHAGPTREVYLVGSNDGKSPEEFVTEIQFPVEKIATPVAA